MNKDRTHRIKRACELAIGIFLIAFACGMDSFTVKVLPDQGFGGEAFSLKTEWITSVVGRVGNPVGGQDAALWRSDGLGGYTLTVLPALGGPDTTARWVDEYVEGGFEVVGGESQTPGGVVKPVAWYDAGPTSFGLLALPTLGGPQGTTSDGQRCMAPLCGGVWIVGTAQTGQGAFHATAWHVDALQQVQTTDLGTLGGPQSEAYALNAHVAYITVVGRAQTPNGAWHACRWVSLDDGETWTIKDIHPGGTNSVLASLDGKGNDVLIEELFGSGSTRLPNGRMVAGYCDMTTDGGGWTALTAKGYQNTLASGVVVERYGLRTIGSAWDDPSSRTPMIWNTILGLDRTQSIRIIQDGNCEEAEFFQDFGLAAIGDGGIAGSATHRVSGIRTPIVLAPNGKQLPDVVNVLVGNPESNFSEIDLWRANDGNTLRVQTQNAQGDTAAIVLRTFLGWDIELTSMDLNVRVRPVGNNEMAQMNMQFFNFLTNQWESAGAAQPLSGWSSAIGSIPFAGGGVNSLTGEVRVRLICSRVSGNVRGYEFDAATLSPGP